MRKYESITRYGKKGTNEMFESGEELIVEEKLDGANASMLLEEGKVRCFSRNQELDEHNTLRGFYQYAQGFADYLTEGYIYYGEWLVPHKVNYHEEHQKKFYLFDVFDIKKDEYVEAINVLGYSINAGMLITPALKIDVFTSVADVMEFVGSSELGDKGEGIVIKYWNSDKRDAIKIVSEEFTESRGTKKQKVNTTSDSLQEFVSATVTPQRVSKILDKLVDDGSIPEDYDFQDMPTILKSVGSLIYEDVMKEESDVLEAIVKKKVGKYSPKVIKEVIINNAG